LTVAFDARATASRGGNRGGFAMLGNHFAQAEPLGVPHRFPERGFRGRRSRGAKRVVQESLPAFKNIPRVEFYHTLDERIWDPSKINQMGSSLCGVASLMYITAKLRPDLYAQFVADLYENGEAKLGNLEIAPSVGCKNFSPGGKIAAADWVALASVRDSENMILDYDDTSDQLAGCTMPSALEGWMEQVGFGNVINDTNLYFTKGIDCLRHADQLHRGGYRVCLFTNADGLAEKPVVRGAISQTATFPNHWVVLTSNIEIADQAVDFTIYTWGKENRRVPFAPMTESSLAMWLQNFYGFVAGKP
jgi:hypothetical protein